MRIVGLWVYPVKGMAGAAVDRVHLGARGPEGDRRWMVVDAEGRFVSQRTVPAMVLVRPTQLPGGLRLEAQDAGVVEVPTPLAGEVREVTVWGDRIPVRDAGEEAARWLRRALGGRFRLVWCPEGAARVRPDGSRRAAAFADAAAVLVVGEASLRDLERRLGRTIDPIRFRPNLMVAGAAPWEEDRHGALEVGDARLRLTTPCTRCSVPGVDPSTGVRQRWLLEGLARHRRFGREVRFGRNAEVERTGEVRVGDAARWG